MPQNKWDFKTFAAKGDSLYRAQASGAPVFDKEYPGISRFDDQGYETDEYILRGLSDGKIDRTDRENYSWSGTNKEGEPVKGKVSGSSYGGMTPRKAYYNKQARQNEEGMPASESASWAFNRMTYGNKPRYDSSGEIVSPHQLHGFYREKTADMDPFQKMDFDRSFRNMVKGMSTRPGPSDDKVMNHIKNQ